MRRRVCIRRALPLFAMLWTLCVVQSAVETKPAAAAGELEVTIEDGRLSATFGAIPIADVLTAVAEQTGARLSVRGELGNARPQAFKGMPLNEALPRIARPNGVILQFDDGAGSGAERRLIAIHAVAPGSPGTAAGIAPRIDLRSAARTPLWDYEESEKLPDPQQRIAALQKLAKQRQPPLQAFSFVLAGDPDPSVRRAALGLIASLPGEEARQTIVQSVADADPEMRMDALRVLAASRQKPVSLLAQVAKGDAEPSVRIAAISLLDRRDGELARAVLEGARSDPDPQVRDAVEQALRR